MRISLILFLSLIIISCDKKTGYISGQEYVIFESLNFHEIYNQTSCELNQNEIKIIETIIAEEVQRNLKLQLKETSSKDKSEDLNTFVRQYSAYIDKTEKKIVTIQFMCNPNDKHVPLKKDWKTTPIENVLDGGFCFFNIYVDLTNKKIHRFID